MEKKNRKTQNLKADSPKVAWGDYPRLPPGDYTAFCRCANWYWEKSYKRHTCILRFDVLADNLVDNLGSVAMWFGGGNDKDKIEAGRKGLFFNAWVTANDGPPPRRDRLAPNVFVRRMARVQVADTKGSSPYSKVSRILRWETAREASTPVISSHSQGRDTGSTLYSKTSGSSLAADRDLNSALPLGRGEATHPSHTKAATDEAVTKLTNRLDAGTLR